MTLDQLINAYKAVHDGITPDDATLARLQYFVQLSDKQPADAAAMSYIVNSADNSTALAVLSYQFFTGKAPTQAGLEYLVNSPSNPSDLNDRYYSGFNLENRYINFAANLGVQGEGAAAFATKYGTLSFADYVASIYQTIIGSAYATAAGIDPTKAVADIVSRKDAILATATAAGMITPNMTAAQIDIALKAATAGYLLGEAIKADVGIYASASNNFMVAVASGTATYGTDITKTYVQPAGVLSGGGGQSVSPGFTFPAPTQPTQPTKPAAVIHNFALTTGVDTFTGESLADTFTGRIGTAATLNATDTLNGAGGTDTLILDSDAASFAFNPAKISNIEVLRVKAQTQALTIDLAEIAFTEVNNNGSSQALTFDNAAPTSTLSINNTTFDTTFITPNTGLGSGSDSITLKLEGVTSAANVTIQSSVARTNEYETLNIVSNGAGNSIKLNTDDTQTSLSTINLSGSAGVTLQFAGGTDHTAQYLTTIDASSLSGGLTVMLAAQGANRVPTSTVILGSGADGVAFVGNTAGGTGAATAATTFAKVTNFTAADRLGFSANNADFSINGHTGLATEAGVDLASGTMVMQSFAQGDSTTAATSGVSFIKLTTGVTFTGDIKTAFADAIGANGILGLGADSNHLVAIYDTTHEQMIVAVVNVGANSAGDDNLFANDFTDGSVAVVGVISMSAGVYAGFSASNLFAF